MPNNYFTSEFEVASALKREHRENFVNTPALNRRLEGSLPLNRRQLKRQLYKRNTSYPLGKTIEYCLEGEKALVYSVFGKGEALPHGEGIFRPKQVTFAEIMNALYDATRYVIETTEDPDLVQKIHKTKQEFAQSCYKYEEGKLLENIILDR